MSRSRSLGPLARLLPARVDAGMLAAEALALVRRRPSALRGVVHDLAGLARLVRAWATGRYRAVPWRTILLAAGALVYLVNPLDAVADLLPVVGYADDAAVIAAVAAAIREDVQRFLRWEEGGDERGAGAAVLPHGHPASG
jgi:uncharacterized membrane protein YkvA (DUF1232 family)